MKKQAIPLFLLLLVMVTITSFACMARKPSDAEILIAIKSNDIAALTNPGDPNPVNTGIPSLDALNRQWNVKQMTPLYPNLSPDDEVAAKYGLVGVFRLVVPDNTNVTAMIKAYEADPHIEYAEFNAPVEIK